MRYLKILLVVITFSMMFVTCKPAQKQMTLKDFAKIDLAIASSDQKPETKEAIAKKAGFTLKQFTDFEMKIQKDPKLIEKLGELRLEGQKKPK